MRIVCLTAILMLNACQDSATENSAVAVYPPPTDSRPIAAIDSVHLEHLTWMEVRDAIQAGSTRILIPTGGIEQNGPYVALNKHDLIANTVASRVARKLGKTLVSPVVSFVPEGDSGSPNAKPTGHMQFPGTISLSPDTFKRLLIDLIRSHLSHGFLEIVLLGDSLDSQAVLREAAEGATPLLPLGATVRYIPEYYNYPLVREWLAKNNIKESEAKFHDELAFTLQLLAIDPRSVRFEQRREGNLLHLNGVSLENLAEMKRLGEQILELRTDLTVKAINKRTH